MAFQNPDDMTFPGEGRAHQRPRDNLQRKYQLFNFPNQIVAVANQTNDKFFILPIYWYLILIYQIT